jgi:rhamnogalacturonyl hydrolase YesR
MLPGIARLAKLEKNPERYDEAIFQMLGFHRRLFDRKDFLYRHIWDITTGQYAPAYWGRGNGWMALAHVDLLETIPKSHRQYSELIRMYREQMSGLLKWESKEGGWTQVIEESSSWVESSCTGMMIWALAKGLKSGWLEDSPAYQGLCERAWDRLCQNVKDDGVVIDTCPSTGPGNKQHYLDRPRLIDDTHSMGPFLMAGAAMLDWQK